MSRYEPRISRNSGYNEPLFYALVVRIDADGSEHVAHGYKGRHFTTRTGAEKSTARYIADVGASETLPASESARITLPRQNDQPPASHTPGPWRLSESGHHILSDEQRTDPNGYPAMIGSIHHKLHGGPYLVTDAEHREAHANARLIAAAPELLAALRECCMLPNKKRPPSVWDAARAAIDKATNQGGE